MDVADGDISGDYVNLSYVFPFYGRDGRYRLLPMVPDLSLYGGSDFCMEQCSLSISFVPVEDGRDGIGGTVSYVPPAHGTASPYWRRSRADDGRSGNSGLVSEKGRGGRAGGISCASVLLPWVLHPVSYKKRKDGTSVPKLQCAGSGYLVRIYRLEQVGAGDRKSATGGQSMAPVRHHGFHFVLSDMDMEEGGRKTMELSIKGLTKQFKDKMAVDHVDLDITPGVWGLLGANGAGKTTLMRMTAGLLAPTEGRIEYDGVPIDTLGEQYRDLFGYLPQEFGFYPEFTVWDYLDYIASLKGMTRKESEKKIQELLPVFGLSDVKKKKIVKLSGGTKRRVGIAQALLNDPEVLILDEPTSGLDPGERVRFRNLLSEFASDRIVLISTHIVSDVEYIASKNAVMKDGKIIAAGTTEELVREIENKVWSAVIPEYDLHSFERNMRIVSIRNEEEQMVSVRYLADRPLIQNSEKCIPRLEDLYLWLFPEEGEER